MKKALATAIEPPASAVTLTTLNVLSKKPAILALRVLDHDQHKPPHLPPSPEP